MINRGPSGIVRTFRRLPALAASSFLFFGCVMQSEPKLDAADMKFAAFYGEYLVRSGTTLSDSTAREVTMTSGDLDYLFVRHGLDQRTFDAKLRTYSKDPSLWREVLLQVRKNLRGQQYRP